MKYVALISVFVLLLISTCAQPTVDIEAETAAVEDVLGEYVKSVEMEDMELYAKLVTHDTTTVNFGGFGKPIVGWTALEKVMEGQNEMLSDTRIEVSDLRVHVSADGKLAWATCLWNLKAMMAENPVELPIRCTWVLGKREVGWMIIHFHKSMAAG